MTLHQSNSMSLPGLSRQSRATRADAWDDMAITSPLMNVMTGRGAQGRARASPRFRRGRGLASVAQGPGGFRFHRRRARGEDIVRGALAMRGPLTAFSWKSAAPSKARTRAIAGSSIRLDGTSNFLHGLTNFAISIALEREGQLVAGVVFAPLSDEMFTAERGQGAWLNGKRLRVSARKNLSRRLDRHRHPLPRQTGPRAFRRRAQGRDARGGGDSPLRRGFARSRLRRGRPLRRFLGAQSEPLGRRRRRRARARGGRLCDRDRRGHADAHRQLDLGRELRASRAPEPPPCGRGQRLNFIHSVAWTTQEVIRSRAGCVRMSHGVRGVC